jgi:hypothetical protein
VSPLGGLTGLKSVRYRTNAFLELLSPPAHLLQWQTCITVLDFHSSMNFDGFRPFTTLFFFGTCCMRGGRLYTTIAPSCYISASYCHLSSTIQTTSIIFVNLQDNQAVFHIFNSMRSDVHGAVNMAIGGPVHGYHHHLTVWPEDEIASFFLRFCLYLSDDAGSCNKEPPSLFPSRVYWRH